MRVYISQMTSADIEQVAELSAQLGYPVSSQDVDQNLKLIRSTPTQDVLVARIAPQGTLVGWIHLYEHLSLATGPRCEIGGLVVDERYRGQGIGTQLLNAAEQWAKKRGLISVRFSSKTSRTEAHRLYARLGYNVQKTSYVFDKRLNSSVSLELDQIPGRTF